MGVDYQEKQLNDIEDGQIMKRRKGGINEQESSSILLWMLYATFGEYAEVFKSTQGKVVNL